MSMSTEVIQDEVDLLAYLSGQQEFIQNERDTMTTKHSEVAAPPKTQALYFKFDSRRAPIDPLERFSVGSEFAMESDPTSFLDHYQYKLLTKVNDNLSYYRSTWANDAEYLAFVTISDAAHVQYRLIFHIYDDRSWIAWRGIYEPFLHRILAQPNILPDPAQPADMNMQVTRLDRRQVNNMGGWY
jgi:hypothetical protein